MSLEDRFEGLSDELKAKAKSCATTDDLVQLANTEGVELTDDELEAIAGGSIWGDSDDLDDCPKFVPEKAS